MAKYVRKPVVIDAVQWTGENIQEILDFAGKAVLTIMKKNQPFQIQTLEGKYTVSVGDWVIRGVKGEYYPCKPDIFKLTYKKWKGGV